MATLIIPHTFVAGTPALASEVNANFQAVVGWTQGQISTDNFGILGARSIALPSAPTLAILSLAQTSSNIALNITNSGTDSSIVINQSGALATGKAAILLNSPSTQTTVGAAEVAMNLATNSTIPALLINHGATPTMSLTKTQLSLFNGAVQATSAGLNATNVTTTGIITAIAPVGNAIALRLAGRSSDNASVLDFTTNNQATQYATVTASSGGLSFNLPDTADGYTFRVNNAIKTSIDNSGFDGQYIKDLSVSTIKIADANITEAKIASPSFISYTVNIPGSLLGNGTWTTISTIGTLTTTQANRTCLVGFKNAAAGYNISVAANTWYYRIRVTGPGGYVGYFARIDQDLTMVPASTNIDVNYDAGGTAMNGWYAFPTSGPLIAWPVNNSKILPLPTVGTYTFTLQFLGPFSNPQWYNYVAYAHLMP